jgi:hypothetical protein
MNEWFGAGDLMPMAVWSLPLAGLVYLGVRAASHALAARAALVRYAFLVLVGLLTGIAWTVLAGLLLGGMIHAFSFPVFICWTVGGGLGGAAAAWVPDRRSWPVAVSFVFAATGAMLWFNRWAEIPEPHVRVILAPGTSPVDQNRFWNEVIGIRGRRPTEHRLLDGISGAGITDYEGDQPVITVRFRKQLSQPRRDSLIARIERSQLVAKVLPGR